jgi:hypothetical protein
MRCAPIQYVTATFQAQPLPADCLTSRWSSATPHPAMSVLMGDASTRTVAPSISLFTWRAILTPSGGEVLDLDWN